MMLSTIICMATLQATPSRQPTAPRQPEQPVPEQREFKGEPTDPLYDKSRVATDPQAFVLLAVENGRQAMLDARTAAGRLDNQQLREAAAVIGRHNEQATRELSELARRKGWRLPQRNPERSSTIEKTPHRTETDFVQHQIAFHEATVSLYRAQLAGDGDPELQRVVQKTLPGYEKNLRMLLAIQP